MPYLKGVKITRQGQGRPRATVDERQAKKLMNQMIAEKTAPLVRSALGKALGERLVFRKEKHFENKKVIYKHVRVIDPDEIEEALDLIDVGGVDPNGNYIYITTKDADMDAIDKLLSRPFGKAKESLEVEGTINLATSLLHLSLEAMKRETPAIEGKIIDV